MIGSKNLEKNAAISSDIMFFGQKMTGFMIRSRGFKWATILLEGREDSHEED